MTDTATASSTPTSSPDVMSSPVPLRTVGADQIAVNGFIPSNQHDVKWALEQLSEHAPAIDAVRVATDVWTALHALLDSTKHEDDDTAGPRLSVDNLLPPGTWIADVSPLVAANTVTVSSASSDPNAITA